MAYSRLGPGDEPGPSVERALTTRASTTKPENGKSDRSRSNPVMADNTSEAAGVNNAAAALRLAARLYVQEHGYDDGDHGGDCPTMRAFIIEAEAAFAAALR